MSYLFTSERLGYRNWLDSDLDTMSLINADERVMEHFPSTVDRDGTLAFIKRMQNNFQNDGYCYFAVDLLASKQMIGFIGINKQDYGDVLGKFTDIGWRLSPSAWGMGYATEGARKCLEEGFERYQLDEIFAVATANNLKSISVMKKAGMTYEKSFDHPKLLEYETLKECVLYIKRKRNSP